MFDGIFKAGKILIYLSIVFIPLGIWKLIELIIWCFHNIHIGLN
jgi:uncharacterized membrane protein